MKHVLVVDDEVEIANILEEILTEYGYSVSIANSGKAAIEFLTKGKYDLIISDIRMPQMDGVELLDSVISTFGRLPPVVMLSGYSEYDEELLHRKGASAFINKPFQTDELLDVVETVIEANNN